MNQCQAFENKDDRDRELTGFVQRFSNFTERIMQILGVILNRYIIMKWKIVIPMDIKIVIMHFCELDIFYDNLYVNGEGVNHLGEDTIIDSEMKCNIDWSDYNFCRFYIRNKFKLLSKRKDALSIHFVNSLKTDDIASLWRDLYEKTTQISYHKQHLANQFV